MPYQHDIPKRVRVLILGGGIHGVGLLHDLASRGIRDTLLVEKDTLASGTSSRSTKLIHGGLRYLKRLSDFGLVSEALKERKLLMNLAPDLVHPLEIYFPILTKGGEYGWMVKAGLTLYDKLAGKNQIAKHAKASNIDIANKASILNTSKIKKVYSYWDGQTDDLSLVLRVSASAAKFGGRIREACKATQIKRSKDGWDVTLKSENGETQQLSALYVVNCLGPWANDFLRENSIKPAYIGVKNKGSHLIFPDMGLKAGLFLQSPSDQRIFFLLPWQGKTLLGTTEDNFKGKPDLLEVSDQEIDYLLSRCNPYLNKTLDKKDICGSFAGIRWLALEKNKNISMTSREFVLSEHHSGRGLMLTLYGGKLTSYRSLSEKIGDLISNHFGEYRPSQTGDKKFWVDSSDSTYTVPSLSERWN